MMNSIGCGGRSMGASSKNHNISGSNIMVDHQLPNVGFDQIDDDAPRAMVKVRAMKPDWNFDVHCGSSIPELGAGNKVPVVPVNPRLWDEGVMAPAASDAALLGHQVDALEVDLSAHINNEHHLFTINQQLCDRLAMCCDELNGEKIEAQLKTLQNQIQESLQLLHHLSERNEALEKEKGDVQRMLQKHVEEFEIKRSSMQAEKRSLNAENVCVQAHIRNLAKDLHFRRLMIQKMVCLENQETKKTMGDLCSTRSTKLGACIPSVVGELQCPAQILQLKQKEKSCAQKSLSFSSSTH